MLQDKPVSNLEFLQGGGEMGALMRSLDFSTTPLGPACEWPQSLRSAVSICLNSRFPIVLYWGPQFISLYNDAYIPILGSKHPWALGQPFEVVWADIWDILGSVLRRVFETGVPSWAEDQPLIMQRFGYPEEVYFTFSFGAGRDERGDVGGIFCAVTETTQRVLHERRLVLLKELTADARTTPEAARLMAAVLEHTLDVPFALLYLNETDGSHAALASHCGLPEHSTAAPARIDLTGEQEPWLQSRTQSDGMVVLTDLERRFGPLPGRPWPESTTSAAVIPLKKAGQSNAGGYLILGISPRRAFDEAYRRFFELVGNHVATMVSNARAYEDERRRAEALAELDRAKTAFFSNVSHEFRTPLTLMLGPVEELLARSHTDLSPSAKGQLEIVNRNGLRLLRLVNSLLDFSRIEAGRVRAQYEPTDLSTFTAELASSFRSATQRAGLNLIIDCPPLSEPVYIDRDMWEKIVLNLVSNAFKFTFEGHIVVRMRQREDAAELVVLDTGVGIPAEALPKLFERFYRVENMRSRTHEGSGIGLAFVQELVKLHGGTVHAESKLAEGSSFTIIIPFGCAHLPADTIGGARTMASTTLATSPFVEEALRWLPDESKGENDGALLPNDFLAVPSPPSGALQGDRPHILLADDNADMRQYIARLLSERYQVDAVADGHAALAAVRAQRPDLILSDVMMPKLDGFGLLRGLRSDPMTKTIPVILLSARAGEESRVEGLEHGADDYLIKPFSARELLARVRAHLELARIRQDAHRERSRLQDELQLILDSAPAMIWYKDTHNRILRVNRLAADSIALSKDQIEGRSVADLYPDHADHYYQDDLIVMKTRAPRLGIVEPYQLGTGETRWIRTDKVPIRNDMDEVVGILVFSQDITEHRQVEKALRESEERLKRVLETDAVGILFFDYSGSVINANDVFLRQTGYRREQIDCRDLHWRTMTPPEWIEASERQMEQFAQTGRIGPYEKEYFFADGSRHWMLFAGRDLGDGTIAEYCIDINDRKEAQRRLEGFSEELEQQVSARTAELLHTQEQLRAMANELNLAEQRERKRLAMELHDHLQQMLVLAKLKLGQGKHTAELVPGCAKIFVETDGILSDALNYTRTLVAELSPPVLLEHGLAAGLKWLGTYMHKHNLNVTVQISAENLTIPEEKAILLFQSVRELLMNCLKHASTDNAQIIMDAKDGFLHIEVRDHGKGFQLPSAVADSIANLQYSKFGLLSIAERMKTLGGSLTLESAPEAGTMVRLTLPFTGTGTSLQSPSPTDGMRVAAIEHQVESVPTTTANNPITVLLVDDHTMVREGLRTVLETYHDVQVVGEACDGEEALILAEKLYPAVVVMDINMPRMNGIAATSQLKTRYPQMLIIGLSINAGEENQAAMKQAGATRLITKDAAVEQLHAVIVQVAKHPRHVDLIHN